MFLDVVSIICDVIKQNGCRSVGTLYRGIGRDTGDGIFSGMAETAELAETAESSFTNY